MTPTRLTARVALPLAAFACLAVPTGALAGKAVPQHVLEGDWHYKGTQITLVERGGAIVGRTVEERSVHGCRVKADEVVYRAFKFSAAQGAKDVWKGLSVVLDDECKRRLSSSKIVVQSESRFVETTRGLAPSTFRRVKPALRDDDPAIATWIRNGAGVTVTREGDRYVGKAREAYVIANGCTIAPGTVIWRLTPSAPERYEGTIQTFLQAPGCKLGALTRSSWRLSAGDQTLTRVAGDGQQFSYARTP